MGVSIQSSTAPRPQEVFLVIVNTKGSCLALNNLENGGVGSNAYYKKFQNYRQKITDKYVSVGKISLLTNFNNG